jgi:hypothetical protein
MGLLLFVMVGGMGLLSLHLQGRRSYTVPFKTVRSLFVFFFFEEKENEFGSDLKMGYDTSNHPREGNIGV